MVTTLRDPNYHKPKHILIAGAANLGKTYFLNQLIGNFYLFFTITKKNYFCVEAQHLTNQTCTLRKGKGKPSLHAYNIYEEDKHIVLFDWAFTTWIC